MPDPVFQPEVAIGSDRLFDLLRYGANIVGMDNVAKGTYRVVFEIAARIAGDLFDGTANVGHGPGLVQEAAIGDPTHVLDQCADPLFAFPQSGFGLLALSYVGHDRDGSAIARRGPHEFDDPTVGKLFLHSLSLPFAVALEALLHQFVNVARAIVAALGPGTHNCAERFATAYRFGGQAIDA